MELQLLSTQVESLTLEKLDTPVQTSDNFGIHYGCAFAQDTVQTFKVFFEMDIDVQAENAAEDDIVTHKMHIKYFAIFGASNEITDEFKESHFPKVNAPAIAYPFLRAFIGTFLLNAGYKPVLLPSFNFAAANK